MKIVFIGGRDIHILGGIESYMLNLATQLVKMEHEPIVFCESDHNGEEFVNGFRVIHQKGFNSNLICKPWLGLKATLKTIRHIHDADIIHYNAWPPSLWSPIARLCGIKSLMQGHGLEWQRIKYSPTQQRIMKFMEWLTAHLNRNLIMCSEDQCRYFKKHYNREATAIPTAIYLPDNNSGDTDILSRFNLSPKGYFLFLARLVQDKNPDYLIEGFKKATRSGKKLVIAGNNPADATYVEKLHNMAKGYPDVIFTDAVYGADKETLLRNAFAFCIPSTIEGLSISLLEAMSYKLPVIASDIAANREVLTDEAALWVRPEKIEDITDVINRALSDTIAFQATAENNYNLVASTYTWPRVAEKYITYLKSITK